MPLVVPDRYGFCHVQHQSILLDIEKDRYFAVPAGLQAGFTAIVNGGATVDPDVTQRLRERGLIVDGTRVGRPLPEPARASHLEDSPYVRISSAAAIEVSLDLIKSRNNPRRRPLSKLVADLSSRARRDTEPTEALLSAADQFLSARPLAPIAPVCLQDSLALIAFLARRGFHPTLVFGVALHPFRAHCWVQVADLVLNDALLTARTHTPILAI